MKSILLKSFLWRTRQKAALSRRSEVGFTIIEVMLVVILIGIFAAIAAPVWDGFVSRQRIRAVNNRVLRELQNAQAEAKRTKQDVTVTFAYEPPPNNYDPLNDPPPPNDPPRFIFHKPTTIIEDTDKQEKLVNKPGIIRNWEKFSIEGEIKPNQVKLDMYNIPQDQYSLDQGIPFTDQGIVDIEKLGEDGGDLPITVVVSTPEDKGKRCVIVETLLGAMRTAEGDDCPPPN